MRRIGFFKTWGGVKPDSAEDERKPRAGLTRNVLSGFDGSFIAGRPGSAVTNLPRIESSTQKLTAFKSTKYPGKVFMAQSDNDNSVRALGVCEPRDIHDDVDTDGVRLDRGSDTAFDTDYDIKRIPEFEDRSYFPVPDRRLEEMLHTEAERRYCGIQAPTSPPSVRVKNITNYIVATIEVLKPANPESSVYDVQIDQAYTGGAASWDYQATSVAWNTDVNTTTRDIYDALSATLDGNEDFELYFRQNKIWIYATPDKTIQCHVWCTDEDAIILDSRFRAWQTGITVTFANSTTEDFTVSAEGALTENTWAVVEGEMIWIKTLTSDGSNQGTATRGLRDTTAAAHTDASIKTVDYFPIERRQHWDIFEDDSYYKVEIRFNDSMAEDEWVNFTINNDRYDQIFVHYKVTSETSGDGEAICEAVYNIISSAPINNDAGGFSACTYQVTRDENILSIESRDDGDDPAVPFTIDNYTGIAISDEYLETDQLSSNLQAGHEYEVQYEVVIRGAVTVTPRLGGMAGTPLTGINGPYPYRYIVNNQRITMPDRELEDDEQVFQMDLDVPLGGTNVVKLERVQIFDKTDNDGVAYLRDGIFSAGEEDDRSNWTPEHWDVEGDENPNYADRWFFPVNGDNILGQRIAILAQSEVYKNDRSLYIRQLQENLISGNVYKVRIHLLKLPTDSKVEVSIDGSSDTLVMKAIDQEEENSTDDIFYEKEFTMDTLEDLDAEDDKYLTIKGWNYNDGDTIIIGFVSMWDVTNNLILDYEIDDPGQWTFGGLWRWENQTEPTAESYATIGNPAELVILDQASSIDEEDKVRFAYQYYSSKRKTWSELSPWTSLYEVIDLLPKVYGFEYPRDYQDDIDAIWLYAAYEGGNGYSDIETMVIDMTDCDRSAQWTGVGAFFQYTLSKEFLSLGTPMPPVGIHEIPPCVSVIEPCGKRIALSGQRAYVSKGSVTAKVINHNTHRIDADNANIEKAKVILQSATVDKSMIWMDCHVDGIFIGQVIDYEQDGTDAVYYMSQKYKGAEYNTYDTRLVEFYGNKKRIWFSGYDTSQSAGSYATIRAETVHPLHYIDVSDEVKDMRYSGGLLFVLMNHGVAPVSNINILGAPVDLYQRSLEDVTGEIQGRSSLLAADRGVFFVANNGLWMANTTGVREVAPHVRRLFSDSDYMDQDTLENVVSCIARTKDHDLIILGGFTRGDYGTAREGWLAVDTKNGEVFEHDNVEMSSNILGAEVDVNPPVVGDSDGYIKAIMDRDLDTDNGNAYTCRWQSDIINFNMVRHGSLCKVSLNQRTDQELRVYVRIGTGLESPIPKTYAALAGDDQGPGGWQDWEYCMIPDNSDHVLFPIPVGSGYQMIVELRWDSGSGPYEINMLEVIGQ